jgi:hypothetical protein
MPRHDIRGRIAYLDLARQETGSEWFSVSRHPDGSRTARCECHFDDVGLVRDVTLTLGPDWRPIDAYLRINHQGRALGAGWFRFGADEVTCHSIDADGRPQQHRRAHTGPVPAFGAHPILNDGFWPALFDLSRPHEVQRLAHAITYSKEMIGNERIGIETFDLDLSYHGEEDVTVPAGTFRCRAFSAQLIGLEAPFRLWTWSDDFIIVKETWAQMPASFELAELQVP